ncbi:MAG: rRNA maturation RNase YbeY [Candidatus Gracilibacteria bacterium]|nr:rRNA maturation RNase YbeY [Candidatus Gracilibacteria bacterium]
MFHYKIINKPKDIKADKKITDHIFSMISENIRIPQNGTLNIVFLDDDVIKELNKQYRNIDSTTDVLSFHYFDDFSNLKIKEIAGEIILSEIRVRSQSKEYGNTLEEEFYKLLIHSILHILGFDHEEDSDFEEMKKEEDIIISDIHEKFGIRIS